MRVKIRMIQMILILENGVNKIVDGKQQHARQIRIIGQLGFWWGMFIYPQTILSR